MEGQLTLPSNQQVKYCECGCNQTVHNTNNRFINGHNHRGISQSRSTVIKRVNSTKFRVTKESVLCNCGCRELTKPGNRFITGHNSRVNPPMKNSEVARRSTETNRLRGNHQKFAERQRINNPSKIPEVILKIAETKRRNGTEAKFTSHWISNPPGRDPELMAKAVATKRLNGSYIQLSERMKANPPVRNPEVVLKIVEAKRRNGWFLQQASIARTVLNSPEVVIKRVQTQRLPYFRELSRKRVLKLMSEGNLNIRSKPQIYVEEFLVNTYGFQFTPNQIIDNFFELDIVLNNLTKTAIEIHGCWFHACKRCNSLIDLDTPGIGKIWYKDKLKARYLERQGWKVLVVWEHDLPKLGSLLNTFLVMVEALKNGFYLNFPEYHPRDVDQHAEKLIKKQLYSEVQNDI